MHLVIGDAWGTQNSLQDVRSACKVTMHLWVRSLFYFILFFIINTHRVAEGNFFNKHRVPRVAPVVWDHDLTIKLNFQIYITPRPRRRVKFCARCEPMSSIQSSIHTVSQEACDLYPHCARMSMWLISKLWVHSLVHASSQEVYLGITHLVTGDTGDLWRIITGGVSRWDDKWILTYFLHSFANTHLITGKVWHSRTLHPCVLCVSF